MRAITRESVDAFIGNYQFNKSNTRVADRDMYLFGNLIAKRTPEGIFISNAGWESNTTKERLNGILSRIGSDRISQKKGVWYIGKKEFPCGQWVKVF
jgi:hypothetical protein